jgi:hypothetical protein
MLDSRIFEFAVSIFDWEWWLKGGKKFLVQPRVWIGREGLDHDMVFVTPSQLATLYREAKERSLSR